MTQSWPGSSNAGVEISTPSIGPATAGLSGLALFCTWQEDKNTAAAPPTTNFVHSLVMTQISRVLEAAGCAHLPATTVLSNQVVGEFRFRAVGLGADG